MACLGTTELLLNSELTDKQRHLASTVHRSGRTLLAIINDILDFSKIEAGKLELESVCFDLSQVLSESLELFVEAARRKQLQLIQHIGEGVPHYLKGDPVRFRQILMNLLSNAIKFTDTGTVSLTTDLVESTTSQVLLRLAVADSGIGIPAAAKVTHFRCLFTSRWLNHPTVRRHRSWDSRLPNNWSPSWAEPLRWTASPGAARPSPLRLGSTARPS